MLSKVGDDQVDQDLTRMWAIPPRPEAAEPSTTEEAPAPEPEAAPFADDEGRFVKRKRRIPQVPHVWQIDEMDCGAASLAIVCRHYGRAVSLARIRQLSHTSLDGTSLRAICQAANELGLAARAVKASRTTCARCRSRASCTGTVITGSCSTTSMRTMPGFRSGHRPPAPHPSRVRRKMERLRRAVRLTTEFEKNKETALGIGWLLPFFKPHQGLILQATALALIVSVLQMVIPVFTQVIVDRVLVERDLNLLNILIGGMAGVVGFTLIATVIQRYLLSFTALGSTRPRSTSSLGGCSASR